MNFYSTQNPSCRASFAAAALRGLAQDGGLFLPETIPAFPVEEMQGLRDMSFPEIAFRVARLYLADEIPGADLRDIIDRAFPFPVPLRTLDEDTSVLELFHGPTYAFKDFGARFMARVLAYLTRNEDTETTVLVATSGDTGSAVAHGFHDVDGIRVALLYPSGRVSRMQEMQLTTLGGNITALEVGGTFDDCQNLVKRALVDREVLARKRLSSANSINIARLLPQAFYYFHAYGKRSGTGRRVVFSVPSGNLGNLTAGLIAQRMGLPVHRFVAASNANRPLPDYLDTGEFRPRESVPTLSSAMDVGNPGNFARLQRLCGGDADGVRQAIYGASVSDEETRKTIREVFAAHGYVLDPHGAVGYGALRRFLGVSRGRYESIILETAHPAKFLDVLETDIADAVRMPDGLRKALQGRKVSVPISTRYEEFRSFLLESHPGDNV